MSKQITIKLNGKDETLEFGKMWFLKFFGENLGSNPLEIGAMVNDAAKQFDFIVSLILSGKQAQCAVEKVKCEYDKKSIEDIVGSMDESEAAEVITKYVEVITPKEKQGQEVANL